MFFLFFLSIKGWFLTTGPQTYMRLYFRSKANSCSFMGSPGIHHARTAIRGSIHIIEMRVTTPWILGLWATQHRTPFGLDVKGGEISSPTHPAQPDYHSFQKWRQNPAQSRRTIGAQRCTSYIHAVRNTRYRS